MQADMRGVFTGFVIAPAFGALACVFAMMIHFVMTDADGAALPLAQLAPLAASIWFSALLFAYPAALAVVLIWLVLRAIGLGPLAVWLGGAGAGFAAMGAYLHQLHGGTIASALAGGRDLAQLTLPELLAAFALPLIGAGSGLLAGVEATTYPTAREALESKGALFVEKPLVTHERMAMAAGCLAGVELDRWLLTQLIDKETADKCIDSGLGWGQGIERVYA